MVICTQKQMPPLLKATQGYSKFALLICSLDIQASQTLVHKLHCLPTAMKLSSPLLASKLIVLCSNAPKSY